MSGFSPPPPGVSEEDLSSYQLRSEKGQPGGYEGLDGGGDPEDSDPAGAAAAAVASHAAAGDPHEAAGYVNGTEATAIAAAEVSTHAGEPDPHAGYVLRSEAGEAGGHAELDGGGKVPVAQLPSAEDLGGIPSSAVSDDDQVPLFNGGWTGVYARTAGKAVLAADTEEQLLSALGSTVLRRQVVIVSDAEIKALRGSPKTLVSAPAAGSIHEFVSAMFYCNTAAGAYTNPQQLAVRDTGSSGAIRSGSTATNLINTTTPTYAQVVPQNCQPNAAAPLVLHNTGPSEITGGNAANSMKVVVYYRTHVLP